MHLFENAIIDDVFAILRGYSYNLENRDSKVFMDTLTKVLTKATTGSIQSIGRKLFTIDAETFDSLRAYFNCAMYLCERVNNAGVGITDTAI